MTANRTVFRVTIPTTELALFLDECEASEWYACDTGERVMTDEGPDAEAVLLVEPARSVARNDARAALMH